MNHDTWSCYHGVLDHPCEICFSGSVKGFYYHRDGRISDVFAGKPDWMTRFGCWLGGWRWLEI